MSVMNFKEIKKCFYKKGERDGHFTSLLFHRKNKNK